MDYDTENGLSAVIAFFVGIAVGATVGLLMAPKRGEEVRDQIRDFANDAIDKTRDYAETMQEKAKSFMNRGPAAMEEGMDVVREKAQEVYSSTSGTRENVDPFRKVS